MAVLVTQEFEASVEQYDKASEKIDAQNNPPDGLILHCGVDAGGGKMKVVDVWESAEKFQTFAEEKIGPVVAEVVGEAAPEPKIEIQELHDLIQP
jgi:hypothetical protein